MECIVLSVEKLQSNMGKTDQPVSTIDLVACREEILKSKRFKIGVLSSSILENPGLKSGNFRILLNFMDERNPEVYITIRKLAMVSLLEIFKDLLPSYSILQISQGVKRMCSAIHGGNDKIARGATSLNNISLINFIRFLFSEKGDLGVAELRGYVTEKLQGLFAEAREDVENFDKKERRHATSERTRSAAWRGSRVVHVRAPRRPSVLQFLR